MKTNYFFALLLTFITTLSFGQELLVNGDLESWDDDKTPTGWKKAESLTKSSTEKHGGSFAAFRNGGKKTKDLAQTVKNIVPGASYTVSFWYKASGDGTDARIWSAWKKGRNYLKDNSKELKGPNKKYLDNNGGAWSNYTVTLTAPVDADSFNFEVRSYSGSKVYWDDLSFVKNAEVKPSLSVKAPREGEIIPSTSTNVSLSVQNFKVAQSGGDGHIHYSLDNGSTVMKYDTNNFTLTNLSTGKHVLKVWLVDDSHQPLNPAVEKTINFTVSPYKTVANIAALKAGTKGNFYELTGEVLLTYARKFRNQKYIQDGTGGILIDDRAKKIKTIYNVGDGITGIKGKLSNYNGVAQFIPTENTAAASSTGNTITPKNVTIKEYKANREKYESKLITFKNVSFTGVKAGDKFKKRKSYKISDGKEQLTFRTNFSKVDYIGKEIPTGKIDLTVLGGEYKGKPQVTAINLAGIKSLSIAKNQIEGFDVYPNPVKGNSFTLRTTSVGIKNVSIYSVLGKQVLDTKVKGTNEKINVSSLKTGIYILKVVENGKIATKKLVVK